MSTCSLVLAQRSSLEFLDLHNDLLEGRASQVTDGPSEVLPEFGYAAGLSERLVSLGLPGPVELLVPSTRGRRSPRGVVLHGHAGPLYLGDLIRIDEGLYACAPELALTEMLPPMSVPRAAALISRVVSSFRMLRPAEVLGYEAAFPHKHVHAMNQGSAGHSTATIYGLEPLTTLDRLHAFERHHERVRGIGRLREALPLCVEELRSPFEVADYLLSFLPRRLGGLNLPAPQVNKPIKLTRAARQIIDVPRLTPDFSWPEEHVIVEVLGAADHTGAAGITDTSLRERVWRTMGYRVMTHTAREIRNPRLFEGLTRELARNLGARYRTDIENFSIRQAWLRGEVLPPYGEWPASVRSWRRLLDDPMDDDGWLAVIEP